MAARTVLLNGRISDRARNAFREVTRGTDFKGVEARMVPRMLATVRSFMEELVRDAFADQRMRSFTTEMRDEIIQGIVVPPATRINDIRALIYASSYVHATEYGGVIKPTRKKYMAIPIHFGLRPDGRPKRTGPRAWKSLKTFVLTAKDGRKYIVYGIKEKTEVEGKTVNKLRFLYRLVDQVQLRPILGLRRKFDKEAFRLLTAWGTIFAEELEKEDLFAKFEEGRRKGLTATAVQSRVGRASLTTNFRFRRT